MSDEKAKPDPQISAARMKLAEQARNVWVLTVEEKLTRAQVTHPDFFAQVAASWRPYDRVEVRCDDGTFFAEFLVLEAARTYARVHVLAWEDLTTKDVEQTQSVNKAKARDALKAYRVESKGPHLLWCVIRNSDGAVLRDKETSQKTAQTWLDEYVRITANA